MTLQIPMFEDDNEPIEYELLSIDDLAECGSSSRESLLAVLGYQLMDGVDVDGQLLRLVKNNTRETVNDNNKYDVDFALVLDGDVIGYIDPEEKQRWTYGDWYYDNVNIALYPMKDWMNGGKWSGTPTKKIRRFIEKPDMSFWLGMRRDWQACMIMPWHMALDYGDIANIKTSYSNDPLKVIAIPRKHGFNCVSADDFTDYIVDYLRSVRKWI